MKAPSGAPAFTGTVAFWPFLTAKRTVDTPSAPSLRIATAPLPVPAMVTL